MSCSKTFKSNVFLMNQVAIVGKVLVYNILSTYSKGNDRYSHQKNKGNMSFANSDVIISMSNVLYNHSVRSGNYIQGVIVKHSHL